MSKAGALPADGTLLFVYAADSGLFNTVADIAHKIFSPQTYECRLCALTHGHFKVRQEWQQFIESLPVPCMFMHRDEAANLPGVDKRCLPAVYRMRQGQWQACLDRDAIAACQTLDQLMTTISSTCREA